MIDGHVLHDPADAWQHRRERRRSRDCGVAPVLGPATLHTALASDGP